jgi:beta-glucanase (GH16 family)
VVVLAGLLLPHGEGGVEPAQAGPPAPAVGGAVEPLWADEFDGDGVDPRQWRALHSTYGDGNNELACLRPGNVTTADGVAVITARAEEATCPSGAVRSYTSGFLSSRDAGRYHPLHSRFEIRARVPHGQGLWPAFWLRHRNGARTAEIDVFEVFHSQRPGTVTHTVHIDGGVRSRHWQHVEHAVVGTGDWHTYGVAIAPAPDDVGVSFTFSIDGVTTHVYTDPEPSWADDAPVDATWDMAVNLAVGGNWTGHPARGLGYLPHPDRCSLTLRRAVDGPEACPSDGIHLASLPATYEIDWVRVSPVTAAPTPTTTTPTTTTSTTTTSTTTTSTTVPSDPPPRTPSEALVDALYLDLLGRAADPEGRAHWSQRLDRGTSRWELTSALAHSEEWAIRTVDALYRDALGRPGDPAGVGYWRDRLRAGERTGAVAAALYGSPEAVAAGRTPAGWVEAAYRGILHRAPEGAGRDHWTAVIAAGGHPGDVAAILWASPEAAGRRVDRLYRLLLDRPPEPEGRAWWTTYLGRHDDLVLAAGLASSDEYGRRAETRAAVSG